MTPKRLLPALVALVTMLPLGARADGSVTMTAPFESGADQITQCQWLASSAGLGVCTMNADPNADVGSVSLDAQISSPDSAAGHHTLPAWGQAIAQGTFFAGYHLANPAQHLTFTFTWHLDAMHFTADGPPVLAWNNAVAQASILQVDCACARAGLSVELSPNAIGTDLVGTLELDSAQPMGDPHGLGQGFTPPEDRPIPAGTFVIKVGFEVQSGLIMTPGLARTTLSGHVVQITVDEVDAPPPPPEG